MEGKKDLKKYRRRILEEHVSFIKQPDSKFWVVTPASGITKFIDNKFQHIDDITSGPQTYVRTITKELELWTTIYNPILIYSDEITGGFRRRYWYRPKILVQ